jgi:hypothetical protein
VNIKQARTLATSYLATATAQRFGVPCTVQTTEWLASLIVDIQAGALQQAAAPLSWLWLRGAAA